MYGYHFQAEHYSWSALGGPESALVKVSAPHGALRNCLDMLGFRVELYNENLQMVWWGFVNKSVVQDDATRISRTLQPVANTVGALYTDKNEEEKFTGWMTSNITKNYNPIGNKELLVELSNTCLLYTSPSPRDS